MWGHLPCPLMAKLALFQLLLANRRCFHRPSFRGCRDQSSLSHPSPSLPVPRYQDDDVVSEAKIVHTLLIVCMNCFCGNSVRIKIETSLYSLDKSPLLGIGGPGPPIPSRTRILGQLSQSWPSCEMPAELACVSMSRQPEPRFLVQVLVWLMSCRVSSFSKSHFFFVQF
jgi:hypothetical protein